MTQSIMTPEDIDTTRLFFGAFGKTETKVSANWIVRFCQERGCGWEPFTFEEIEAFYNERGHHDFWFNALVPSWIEKDSFGVYSITKDFVQRCYTSSPKR